MKGDEEIYDNMSDVKSCVCSLGITIQSTAFWDEQTRDREIRDG